MKKLSRLINLHRGLTMSRKETLEIKCACGHRFETELWRSANVTASPELKRQILEGQMNVVTCPECKSRFHVEIPFLYHDIERGEMIWVYPLEYQAEAGLVREDIEKMWEKIRETMPPKIRKIIESRYKTVTVVFGMDALVRYLKSEDEPSSSGKACPT